MRNGIKITIEGAPGTGKSILAGIITSWLELEGANVVEVVDDGYRGEKSAIPLVINRMDVTIITKKAPKS